MDEIAPIDEIAPAEASPPAEAALGIRSLARELAREYERARRYYAERAELAPTEADAAARALAGDDADRILEAPPDEVSWAALQRAAERDPALAERAWEGLLDAAADELASGHRAALALEADGGSPWQRARFLAVRRAFRDDWQPRGGLEDALVDALAQAYCAQEFWTRRLQARASFEAAREDKEVGRDGTWEPPTLDRAAAVDQAAAMADRYNKNFLRTLRALRDLRRYAPTVVVQNAGQVNVGEQQVNVVREEA